MHGQKNIKLLGDCLPIQAKQSTTYGTGSNLNQERVDFGKHELIVVEINTGFNHKTQKMILL